MISTGNIIVIGIVLFILGVGAYYYDKEKNTHHLVNAFLWLSWISAAAFAIHIFSLINADKTQSAIALSPLGMMIAALIASASVMKNIAETKAHDISKSEKEKSRKRKYVINALLTITNTIESFVNDNTENKKNHVLFKDDINLNITKVEKIFDLVFTHEVLPYLTEIEESMMVDIFKEFHKFIAIHINSSDAGNMSPTRKGRIMKEYKQLTVEINKYISNSQISLANKDPQ